MTPALVEQPSGSAVRVVALVVEGSIDDATRAMLREAMSAPDMSVVAALPTIADIISFVAFETGVPVRTVIGPSRDPRSSRARFAVAWIARQLGHRTLRQIGNALGQRDHSTISNALRRAATLRDRDPAFVRLTEKALAHFLGDARWQ